MSAPLPEQFVTIQTLATASGCGLVVYVIVNGVRSFLGFSRKWLFLAVSFVVVFGVYHATGQPWTPVAILVLIANMFLVAFGALGLQEGTVRGLTSGEGREFSLKRQPWRSSWLD
jgi:hypothetical protein